MPIEPHAPALRPTGSRYTVRALMGAAITLLGSTSACAASTAAQTTATPATTASRSLASASLTVSDELSPDAVLDHTIGVGAVSHAEVLRYGETLAAASDRVTMQQYATSHEGRPLIVWTITSAANHARLDEIRAANAAISNPRGSIAELRASTGDLPGVAWLAACIHGDEMSGTDALLRLAHRLATSDDPFAQRVRDELVVIIDPNQNPDGRDRYLAQIEAMTGRVPNPDHAAQHHAGGWSGGRTNHYRFDLNRDWVPMAHHETRARAAKINEWNPLLLVDAHEMGALDTFLFDPPREPIHPDQSPAVLERRTRFGEEMAAAFDAKGWPYYTRAWYEEWYPGYTNAWASLGGALGILYEQASLDGGSVRKRTGMIETYADAVDHMETSFVANLTSLLEQRADLLRERLDDRLAAIGRGDEAGDAVAAIEAAMPSGTLILLPGSDPADADRLAHLLTYHGVESARTGESMTIASGRTSMGERIEEPRTIPAGAWVITSDQPHRRRLHAVAGFDPRMTDEFLAQERRELAEGRGSMLYDVTAWSLPMAHGVDAIWTDDDAALSVRTDAQMTAGDPAVTRAARIDVDPAATVGYIIDAHGADSAQLLVRLLDGGIVVHVSAKPFTLAGTTHPAGSLLVRRDDNSDIDDLPAQVRAACDGLSVHVRSASSGFTSDGVDLGGEEFHVLQQPRVAIVTRWPISPTSFGAAWFALDAQLGIRCSPIAATDLGSADLRRYTVLVLPEGFGLSRVLDDRTTGRLRTWIEAGGTLVTIGSSTDWAIANGLSGARSRSSVLGDLETWLADIELERTAPDMPVDLAAVWAGTPDMPDQTVPRAPGDADQSGADADDDAPAPPAPGTAESLPSSKEERERLESWQRRFAPTGAFLMAEVDTDHWLGWGVAREIPLLVGGSRALLSRTPTQTPVRVGAADSMRLSGLVWPEGRVRLHRASAATVNRFGRGQVVCFAYDPVFRGMTEGTSRLFENAIMFGPTMGASPALPW